MDCRTRELRLHKLRIRRSSAEDIKRELHGMGVDRSTVFPDLEGLSATLKWEYHLSH
jgi:hypothetical protein